MKTHRYLGVATIISGGGTAFAGYRVEAAWPKAANFALAVAGTAFAGWLTRDEVVTHSGYRLGLPTCAYGLVFFVGLLVWTLAAVTSPAHEPRTATR